jgi:hypothetical protein
MSWRNLLAFIFGDFCGGSNCPGVTPTIPAKKADAREFQDCYCARIGLCWAPSSRMIDRISPTIRNEPVTRIQPRPRAKTAMAHRELAVQQRGRIRSFSVDFANYGAAFVASSDFHKASDTPFTRDFVAHVGCDHTEVVLDSRELADQDLRRAVIQAADFPLGTSRDMYSSLYRLFQAVRSESTVAYRVNQQTRSSVDLLARPLGTTGSLPERAGLERARSISAWVKDYGIVLDL